MVGICWAGKGHRPIKMMQIEALDALDPVILPPAVRRPVGAAGEQAVQTGLQMPTRPVGVVTRAAGTGDAYAAWKASEPPIPPRLGRLFVYAPNRQVSLWTADWATGGEFVFDVDRDVCDVIGSSFAYVDLPAGVHSISASDIKKFPGGFQIGKYLTMVRIVEGKTTFARIDPVPGAPTLVTLGGPMVRLVVGRA